MLFAIKITSVICRPKEGKDPSFRADYHTLWVNAFGDGITKYDLFELVDDTGKYTRKGFKEKKLEEEKANKNK